MLPANASGTGKGSFTFSLSLPDYSNQNLYLSYLTADGADSLSGTTWNGISYESSNDGTSETIIAIPIGSNGKVSVTVRDGQAVIANIGWLLGSNAVLTPSSTSTNPGAAQSGTKRSSAVTSTASASTALSSSAVTTIIAWMSSVSSGIVDATPTSRLTDTAERTWGRGRLISIAVGTGAVVVGFVCVA